MSFVASSNWKVPGGHTIESTSKAGAFAQRVKDARASNVYIIRTGEDTYLVVDIWADRLVDAKAIGGLMRQHESEQWEAPAETLPGVGVSGEVIGQL